ncbi:MAG: inorganic diphosphatase [Myxococcota bacterium]
MSLPAPGDTVDVVIEIPRGSRVKRRPDGSVEYVSPVAVPFDYGCVPSLLSGDGDPLDAIVLGGPRPVGTRLSIPVRGVVPFIDAGRADPKLCCAESPLTDDDRRRLARFFWWFARAKWVFNALRGVEGPTEAGNLVEHGPVGTPTD